MVHVGIDVGGTFTDIVLLDTETGGTSWFKVPTDVESPSRGVLDALTATGVRVEEIASVKLGTTLGMNAILTRSGARTGLITTDGFRDVLEIQRTHRRQLFDLNERFPPPLVPRNLRCEVIERVGADGKVVRSLDEDGVRRSWRALRAAGVEALAIVFLWSFENPTHERRAREIVREEGGPEMIFISSDVLPAYREYERTSTTVAAAYIANSVRSYVSGLSAEFERRGLTADQLSIMTNSGGVLAPGAVAEHPISTLLSGPVGGVAAARWLANRVDYDNVLTLDMGGTSCDVSSIVDGIPDKRLDMDIDGLTISSPTFDIETIGAGGGSIAWVDSGGTLRVGPSSAGSHPGPACYGRGGIQPTVTDANLVLGRYDPLALLAGTIRLDVDAALAAIARIAVPLGLSVEDAAAGIIRIVNAHMWNAVRMISVERGRDIRDFTLVAFGGAGPTHAAEIAKDLAIPRVLVPPFPGCTSAFGAVISESRRDFLRTVGRRIDRVDVAALRGLVAELDAQAREMLLDEGYSAVESAVELWLEVRYEGQAHELSVRHEGLVVDDASLAAAVTAFQRLHKQLYGHAFDDVPVELVHIRVSGAGRRPEPPMWWDWQRTLPEGGQLERKRRVWFQEVNQFLDAQVLLREELDATRPVQGPAVIHQIDSTVIVPRSFVCQPHSSGSLVLYASEVDAELGDPNSALSPAYA